jgi:SAM-dependent methyltransferase
MPDLAGALSSPSFLRNRDPILSVLRRVLPHTGTVLEVASGSGEHAVYFATALRDLTWQPSDADETALRSIAARRAAAELPNLQPPLELDAASESWPIARADAVIAINMIHISPWRATVGLISGARRVLGSGGLLYLSGPFEENGRHTAPSNAAFDESLRGRNPEWGFRDLTQVVELARSYGLALVGRIDMPANNLSVIFRKTGTEGQVGADPA